MKVDAIRGGDKYESKNKKFVKDYSGNEILEVSQLSPLSLFAEDLGLASKDGYNKFNEMSAEDILSKIEKAGEHFVSEVEGETFEDYCYKVVKLTGQPISNVKRAGKLVADEMSDIKNNVLAQLPRKNLQLLDEYNSSNNFILTPRGKNLGVVAPSNHPAVNLIWLMGFAMKFPVLIRPANSEPITSRRLVKSLYAAGLPENSLFFLPGSEAFADELLEGADLGMIFGSKQVVNNYDDKDTIKAYGPGNSKIYIDEEYIDKDIALEISAQSMMADGGRGCINISQIVVEGNARNFAYKLAERIDNNKIAEPIKQDAVIPAMPEGYSEEINEYIEMSMDGAIDVNNENENRLVKMEETAFLRPTVVYINNNPQEHRLFSELPFQYTAITHYEEKILNNSLTLTMLTEDERKIEKAILNPTIEKVYVGTPTVDIDLKQPHEGYISEFLFKKKAYKYTL